MDARPYILGCLCLVGATGTVAAKDIDLTSGLLSSMSGAVSSSFEGAGTRASQGGGGRDTNAGDVSTRPVSATPHSRPTSPIASPVDADDDLHDGSPSSRSSTPSWQSLLPGSIF